MTKQDIKIINRLVIPQLSIGNHAAANDIMDSLIRSAMSTKAKQALIDWKQANIDPSRPQWVNLGLGF